MKKYKFALLIFIILFISISTLNINCNRKRSLKVLKKTIVENDEVIVNNNIKWKIDLADNISSLNMKNNTIFISSYSYLKALDVNTGNIKWESKTNRAINSPNICNPLLYDNFVYLTDTSFAYCFYSNTGLIKWKYEFKNEYLIMSSLRMEQILWRKR